MFIAKLYMSMWRSHLYGWIYHIFFFNIFYWLCKVFSWKSIKNHELADFFKKKIVMKLELHALRDGMVSIIWFYLFWKIIFKVSLFELRMKLDINHLCCFSKNHNNLFLKIKTVQLIVNLHKNHEKFLVDENRPIWIEFEQSKSVQRPIFERRRLKV